MNQKLIDCLSSDDLLEFLSTEVEVHGSPTEAHLSDCTQCRQRLEELSASAEIWDEARASLTPMEPMGNEFSATRQFPQPGDSIAQDAAEHLGSIDEPAYLSILGPTDDPEKMGRIGSYEVVGVVGQGGMGVVFKAYDAPLNRFVAIKMLLPHLAVSATARQRFAREAQAAAAVIDDHVTPIYNVAQWKEIPYLVTQYCVGSTLRKRIADRGQMPLKEVLRIGMQTAKGLAAAHAQGLVHRDVKPSNILLDGEVERAMLTDFGLARAVDDASITRTGVITGTPQYMSPEQARGDSIDARSDLFSLGSTLYAMCAGRPPFRSESAYGVMHRITHEEPTPISEVNSDVPPWMETIIERLMSKMVDDRFESAEEVAQLLESCLAHVQQPKTTKLPEVLASMSSNRGGSSSWGKWLAAASFAFVLALGGILLVLELNKGRLVIECAADNVPIRIMQGEQEIEKLTVSKDGATVKIAAGKYIVEIDGGSDKVVVEDDLATLSRGGVETVTIALKGVTDSYAECWTPPENPDPGNILQEAGPDAKPGDYEIALAKHLWYHENAVQIQPSQSAVRLSFALSSWLRLGEKFPPALAKLREVRDATEARIRDEDRVRVGFDDFHDFTSLNATLRNEQRTVDLFKWVETESSKDADIVYGISEAALIKQQQYAICGKYVDPIKDVRNICRSYEDGLDSATKFGESYLRVVENTFVSKSATLIEILIENDRTEEAKVAAASLKEFAEGKDIAAKLNAALSSIGTRPKPNNKPNPRPVADEAKIKTDAEGWTPPENPDPNKIRKEAKRDADAGNYEIALAKHLWYHENALQLGVGQGGVRLSYALNDWLELGEKYPPALAKLREVRDATETRIRDEDRVRVDFGDFHDFVALNRTLENDQRTVDLFMWVETESAKDAARVYPVSEAALIKQQEYKICGKYINPIKDVKRIFRSYEDGMDNVSKFGEPYLDYVERKIVKDGATLIKILVENGRKEEAQIAAASLREFAEGKDIAAELDAALKSALKGVVHLDAKDWTPPENPDPSEILEEAARDADTGRFEQALAKHLWYHENAIQIDPSQSGVRLSFALGSWVKLGQKYPPALAKLREVRDATETRIRDEDRVEMEFEDFHDFASLNDALGNQQRTVDLFKWLDTKKSEEADIVYHIAEAALIKQREYKICGKYIEPRKDVRNICRTYEDGLDMASELGGRHLTFVVNTFVSGSGTLMNILLKNDRKEEAKVAAATLKKFAKSKDIDFSLIPKDDPNSRSVGDKVEFKINSVELSKYEGATIKARGKTLYKVPKMERALVLTYTTEGTKTFEIPTVRLNNGTLVAAKVGSKIVQAEMQFDSSGETGVTREEWYPVDKSLPLNAIFPCVVQIGVGEGMGRNIISVEGVPW